MQDLCERHEKGVLHEHQRALQKYSVMKRQMMMSAAAQSKEQVSVEQLESRIVQVAPASLCSLPNLARFFLMSRQGCCCCRGGKNDGFFDAPRFSLGGFCLDADNENFIDFFFY